MKTKFAFLVLLAAGLTFTACSDDDTTNPYAHESTIQVEQSDLDFSAEGGTGTVSVNVAQGFTASSSVSWAVPTINGSDITVVCEPNDDPNGRTGVITIHNGNESTQVTVHQKGIILRTVMPAKIVISDAPTDSTYSATYTGKIQVLSSAEWIIPEIADSTFSLHFAENNTGTIRQAEVTLKNGPLTKKMTVIQVSVNDLYNKEINFMGIGGSLSAPLGPIGTAETYTGKLVKVGNSSFLHLDLNLWGFIDVPIDVPVTINPKTFAMTIRPSAKSVGQDAFGSSYYNIAFAKIDDIADLKDPTKLVYDQKKMMVGEFNLIDANTFAWSFIDGDYLVFSVQECSAEDYTDPSQLSGVSIGNFVMPFIYCGNVAPSMK